jgi:hypothetical protein
VAKYGKEPNLSRIVIITVIDSDIMRYMQVDKVIKLNKKFWKELICLLSLHYLKMSFALKPAFAPT